MAFHFSVCSSAKDIIETTLDRAGRFVSLGPWFYTTVRADDSYFEVAAQDEDVDMDAADEKSSPKMTMISCLSQYMFSDDQKITDAILQSLPRAQAYKLHDQ